MPSWGSALPRGLLCCLVELAVENTSTELCSMFFLFYCVLKLQDCEIQFD